MQGEHGLVDVRVLGPIEVGRLQEVADPQDRHRGRSGSSRARSARLRPPVAPACRCSSSRFRLLRHRRTGDARPDRICGTCRAGRIAIVSAGSMGLSPPVWVSGPAAVEGMWKVLAGDLPPDYGRLIRQLACRARGQRPQPSGGSLRPAIRCQASHWSATRPSASKRRTDVPASVASSPASSSAAHQLTAARSPSTIGSPNQARTSDSSPNAPRRTRARPRARGRASRNGWLEKVRLRRTARRSGPPRAPPSSAARSLPSWRPLCRRRSRSDRAYEPSGLGDDAHADGCLDARHEAHVDLVVAERLDRLAQVERMAVELDPLARG